MYLIEFLIKKFKKTPKDDDYFEPLSEETAEFQEYESCEHLFMPIDSTNTVLACSKCGFLKKTEELKKKNFFES